MKSPKARFNSIDEYIATFPESVQKILEEIRATIKAAAPGAEEKISYNMPAFKVNGEFFAHFAAWKTHIGMYPIPAGDESFQKEVLQYQGAKSALNFPIDKPIPLNLIGRIVKFRIAENLQNAKLKSSK